MSRYAILDGDTVVNIVLWDGETPLDGLDPTPCGDEPVSPGWKRIDGEWVAPPEDGPEPESPPGPTIDDLRHAEYTKPGGADALFMKWRRGEGTEQEWLDEIERVRLLYPDSEESDDPA